MHIEIEGTIIKALEPRTGTSSRTGNTWQRQDFVLETPGQYPRKCLFTVADGNIALFNLQEGQQVRVTLSLDAREYQGRYYNDFRAINVINPDAVQQNTGGIPPIGAPLPPPAEPQAISDNQALPWE